MTQVKWFLVSLFLFVAIIGIQGCTNDEAIKNGWRALAVSSTTYNTVMEAAGRLYKDGKLSEDNKDMLVKVGKVYTISYNAAIRALQTYENVVTSGAEEKDVLYAKTVFKVSAQVLKDDLFNLIDDYNNITEAIGTTKIEKPEAVNVQ